MKCYVVLNAETKIIYGCFKKEKSAESFINGNPVFWVKKLKIDKK